MVSEGKTSQSQEGQQLPSPVSTGFKRVQSERPSLGHRQPWP